MGSKKTQRSRWGCKGFSYLFQVLCVAFNVCVGVGIRNIFLFGEAITLL